MNDILAVALVALAALYAFESRAWRAERGRLLDRIMAKSYSDYVYTTKTESDAETVAIAHDAPDLAWHEQNMKDHPEQYPDGIEAYE